jgi:hypothetical protein
MLKFLAEKCSKYANNFIISPLIFEKPVNAPSIVDGQDGSLERWNSIFAAEIVTKNAYRVLDKRPERTK